MIVVLVVLAALQADPLERELEDIVRRLEHSELAERQAAVRGLEEFSKKAGRRAAGFLRNRAESLQGEARARLDDQLRFLGQVEECRNLLAIFDATGLPDCKGKRLALYNPNSWWRGTDSFGFSYVMGWVLDETKEAVTLAETNLTIQAYTRDRRLPDDWDRWKEKHPKDRPLPGELAILDFGTFCGRLLGEGPAEDFGDLDHFSRGGLSHGIEPALFAFWALQRGEEKLALKLLELSKRSATEKREKENVPPFGEVLREAVAGNLRWQAITRANGGEPRDKILERWRTLDRIAPGLGEGEAKEMVRLYEELAAEDARWKDPSPEQLTKMDASARAAVWMHRLRDHAATQMMQPGGCIVLGTFGRGREGSPNPADELVKLSWDALPSIIEHLDDRRPTRCMGYWRNFAPGSYYLLRVGDCCQQIFKAITGFDIDRRKDGDAPGAKAAAQKWWEENRKEGAEAFFLKGLESTESLSFSARRLLELDATKHLPGFFGMLEKGDPERRRTLLHVLKPHFTREHRSVLESFLKDGELSAVTCASELLWTLNSSEAGAREILARLKALPKEENYLDHFYTSPAAFGVLRIIGGDAVEVGVCALMTSPSTRVRTDAMSCAAKMPSRRTAEALVAQLEDQAFTGWGGEYKIRFCDHAASQLTELLDLSKKFPLKGDEAQRDRTLGALKGWWNENRDRIDWAAHRKRVEEARAQEK